MSTQTHDQLRPAQAITGSVRSADGTTIGYRRLGTGPAVVILHGSNESARSHLGLAAGLARDFTVYLPDRRGRGLSGPHRAGHSMRTEVEDLNAVLAASGAQRVFGVSISGLIVAEAARLNPAIRRAALYEPAVLLDPAQGVGTGYTGYTGWMRRFDEELARGDVAGALITSMFGFDLAPAAFRFLPRRLLAALTNAAMKSEDKKAAPDEVTMRQVAPTLRYEGLLLAQTRGTIGRFAEISAEVLLMGGDMKQPAFIRPAFDAFARTLPHSRPVTFPGLGHGASGDIGPANRDGQPQVLVPELRSFFAGP